MMLWSPSDGAYYSMLLHYNYLFTDSKTVQILIHCGFVVEIFPGNSCKSTGNKLNDTVNEIFDLSACKRRLQLSENLLLAPMSVSVTRSEDKDIKAALSSLFLKLKSSFSFTVTLINIHNDPSQFPRCSLVICFYKDVIQHRSFHSSFILCILLRVLSVEFPVCWKVAQRGLVKRTKQNWKSYLLIC